MQSGGSTSEVQELPPAKQKLVMRKIILVASIAAGVQFGWALQLSLLTPYVQLLGINHEWAPYIWLCGPVAGMIVQPLVGYFSDRCTSRFGRRSPFIAAGVALVAVAVLLIGYAADIGHLAGDPLDHIPKKRAVAVFVVGFWILDVANNMLQGPCRALLADLSGDDHRKTRTANAFFSFFMAVGNVLGYAAGAFTHLHDIFPFTQTHACDVYCANLKSCFFLSIALLLIVSSIALAIVREDPWYREIEEVNEAKSKPESGPMFGEIVGALRGMSRPMWILLMVTCLNWIAWFPFTLFDTDWMGREVFGGEPGVKGVLGEAYDKGVRLGAVGLLLNSVVLGVVSLAVEQAARGLGGVTKLWGVVNFILAVGFGAMVLITKRAQSIRRVQGVILPSTATKAGALAVFAVLGIPLAVTYSVPFALASIFSSASGAGQGLSLGLLNIAICIPQILVSMVSGHWDDMFGGGNLPAFAAAGVVAVVSGVLAFTVLPAPPPDAPPAGSVAAGFH
ncbi:hypothetical protein NMG60_11035756 [Bertholletia excelsa]